jgi:hypothetical protein
MARMGNSATDYKVRARGASMEERRRSPRTRIVDCVYLNIEPDNGGILLDVSSTALDSKPLPLFSIVSTWNSDIHTTATHFRWVAVGRGSTEAEVELANLYLLGDGVLGKNCE